MECDITAVKYKFAPKKRKKVLVALGYNDHLLMNGIWRYCQEANWILDTSMAHYGKIPEMWRGDGIITIVYPHLRQLQSYVKNFHGSVVNMTKDVDVGHHVVLNNHACGEIAAEHLMERGFSRFAFLQFSEAQDILGRLQGFTQRVEQAGGEVIVLDGSRQADPYTWLAPKLASLSKPIGILAQSDTRANFLASLCESIGIKIPEEIAVVGVDNNEIVCLSSPTPLSSVDSNRSRMAYEASALLDRLMDKEIVSEEPRIITPKGVASRKSSNILTGLQYT